jgi:DNA invertase Pin-like site-specific DNA recombinase
MAKPLIAYVRVSRVGDRTEETFRSPQEQEERARSFAASRGHSVSEVVRDIDVSGATPPRDRPGMAFALAEIEAGRAGGLVAYSLDRFSREPAHGDELVKLVTEAGGVILAPDLPADLDTAVGEFQFGVLLQVARLYRRTAGERLDSARARATREGIFVGSVLPFGYRRREDRRMEVDPETGPIVSELFQRRLAGEDMGSLARWMADRTGHKWSRTGVRDLLGRELYYTGRITNGETVSEWDSGALVDAADWHAVQALRQSIQAGRNAKGQHLLSGLLLCGSCGHRMVYVRPSSKQSKGTRPKYKCPNALKCSERVHVHGDVVEELVAEEAFRVSRSLVARQTEQTDLAEFEEALADAERRLEQMLTPESQDALGEKWAATAKARREERDAAAAALGEARHAAGATGYGLVLNLWQAWQEMSPLEQREALSWVFDSVTAHPVETRGTRSGRRSPGPPELTFAVRTSRPGKPMRWSDETLAVS